MHIIILSQKVGWLGGIVVTYSQFDSNIRVLYVFVGFLKNTWKYLIQRPIFKPLYFYSVILKILENTSFLAPSKNTRISYVTTMLGGQRFYFHPWGSKINPHKWHGLWSTVVSWLSIPYLHSLLNRLGGLPNNLN